MACSPESSNDAFSFERLRTMSPAEFYKHGLDCSTGRSSKNFHEDLLKIKTRDLTRLCSVHLIKLGGNRCPSQQKSALVGYILHNCFMRGGMLEVESNSTLAQVVEKVDRLFVERARSRSPRRLVLKGPRPASP
eukprot:TRINITY_DN8813_c0_g1_i2.p1 TRINITY_DN8813_c0_g1~~TRINITY_DN8813_c0_g1_i2.p1  ORF type:complete len:134 (-),score=18.85 TRINITY_DN8813_c0_g1_i2:147-548(-)